MLLKSVLILFFCISAFGQSPLGTVTGLATDSTGSPVPDAAITLKNQATGVQQETRTNQTGVYSFFNLPPGVYKLNADSKGFRPIEADSLSVPAFRIVRQDLHFEVAAASSEITISESVSPVIQRESPSINSSLTSKQVQELPTNLRSIYNNAGDSGLVFTMMPLTIPGVVQVDGGAKWLVPGSGATGIKVKVDGIETNFGIFGSPDTVSQPSLESVQEFTANILTNRAEFGGMGTITSVTRAGTNKLHADIFWYARNSALDARNAFAVTKQFQNVHQYGITAGGPIRKDRTFGMFTFDGTRGVRVCPTCLLTSNVPTLNMRNGDFTGQAALRNPFTGVNPYDATGTRILPQFISPQAKKAQELFFPNPNFGPADLLAGNYRASFTAPEVHRIVEFRLDHNWSSRHSTFGRYEFKKDDYNIPGARTTLPASSVGTSTNIRRANIWTLGDVYTISPNIFNEFRAGALVLVSQSHADRNGRDLLTQLNVSPMLPFRPGESGVPNIGITGFSTVTQTLLNPVNDGHWQLSDNLTWIRGRHTAKFGGEVVHWFVNQYQATVAGLFGNFSFTNRFTGNAYADFLLGLPNAVTRVDPAPTQYDRFTDLAFYAQDDYKVTPKLTLSYGLRYEYNGPAKPKDGNFYSFDLASGSVVIPGEGSRRQLSPFLPANIPVITADKVGLGDSLRRADKNNWAPRFAFSYQLGNSGKTIIRGGWGVYYSHLSAQIPSSLAGGPYTLSTTNNNNFVNGQPLFTFANPFANAGAGGALSLTAVSPRLLNSYAQQYSVSVERELTHDIGLRVSYIGSKGSQLIYSRDVNQVPASTTAFSAARRPYPLFNVIGYADNGANMLYSGLQVVLTKRLSKGLLFSSAWTWAKELSDTDDTGGFELNTAIENSYDRRRDRADVHSVPRHQWMNQVLYELPGRGRLLGGWQANVLLNASSGHFLNQQFSGSDPSNTNTIGGRPDVVKAVDYPKTTSAWYDRTAFAPPPANAGRFGNSARNMIVGPGYVIFNAGLMKTIRMERAGAIQLGISFVNLLNHTNLGPPNLTTNIANGGTITATHVFPVAGSPRQGQMSLRWSF